MKRCDEKIAVALSWFVEEKLPVNAMRMSEYRRERHMKTRSLRSLSIRASSASPSSRLSEESKRNSNASPKPFPVYRYSSSFEKSVGLIGTGSRRRTPVFVDGAGDGARKGDGDREIEVKSTPSVRERAD